MLQQEAFRSSDPELAERVLRHWVGVGCPQPSGAGSQTVQPRAASSRCRGDSDFQSQSWARTQDAGTVWGSGQGRETRAPAHCSPALTEGLTHGEQVQGRPRGTHRDPEALMGMTTASLWPGPLPTSGQHTVHKGQVGSGEAGGGPEEQPPRCSGAIGKKERPAPGAHPC